MAPGPDGTLVVSIPRPGGSILAVLDRRGSPLPGWPIAIRDSTVCELLLPVEDGSVRVVCTLENLEGNMFPPTAAFAFDSASNLIAGWPVALDGFDFMGRVLSDRSLALAVATSLGDVIPEGEPAQAVGLRTIDPLGALSVGIDVPGGACCGAWSAVGPDGIAYGVRTDYRTGSVSSIAAIDLTGARGGWPVSLDGIASGPAFGPTGRIFLAVADPGSGTTRVLVVDPDAKTVTARSSELLIETGVLPPSIDGPYECGVPVPRPPLVAPDGATFVYSEIDDATYGLDPSLNVMSGWPIVAGRLERPNPWLGQDGITCPSMAIPAVGRDRTLYLPLVARDATVGGRLVAVGPDGRTRPGWPVDLQRPGSEFWSVVVGSDGTAYALAIEPEAGGSSSATILAIAADGAVNYATTIIDP